MAIILRCDQAAIESAKETVFEVAGLPLHDQLRVEAMWGYALCAGNPSVAGRSQEFFSKTDRGRAWRDGEPAVAVLRPAADAGHRSIEIPAAVKYVNGQSI